MVHGLHFLIKRLALIIALNHSAVALAQTCAELDGAYVLADDGSARYLGFFGSEYAEESIMNEYGVFGSPYQANSVRNEYGTYGSEYSAYSANDPYALNPPIIFINEQPAYYLTTNSVMIPGVSLGEIDALCAFTSIVPLSSSSTPAAPSAIQAADGADPAVLTVTWSSSLGASGYNVYISETDGNYRYLGSTSQLGTTITGLTPGVIYYVAVGAANTVGESQYAVDTGYVGDLGDNPSNVFRLSIEEPVVGETHTGVGNLRGWALSSAGIERVEVYIDGEYAFDAPYGGNRGDVASVFPDVQDSDSSGFSLAFNYSDLPAGSHVISVKAYDTAGNHKDASSQFNVVRFDSSFIAQEDAVDLEGSMCSVGGDEIQVFDALVDGLLYDFRLKWRTAEQGFEMVEVD